MALRLLILGLLISFLSTNLWARIEGQGRFYAQDTDSISFVKKQLLSSAFRDVITQELSNMGLNAPLFWQKYDEKFEDYFEPVEAEIKRKLGADEQGQLPPKNIEQFEKSRRLKRLSLKANFGRLSRVINSYVIKKMSRSTRSAQARFLKLEAQVNRKVLNQIYFQFTREESARHFVHIYMTPEFVLEGLTWSDLGVAVKSDLTEVIVNHWKDWFEKKLAGYINQVIVTNEDLSQKLEQHVKFPPHSGLFNPSEATGEAEKPEIELSEFSHSLWIKMRVNLNYGGESRLLKWRKISMDGQYLVIDLKDASVVDAYDFDKEEHRYETNDAHVYSSNLASHIFRLPLNKLKDLSAKIDQLPGDLKTIELEVNNVHSIVELLELKRLLSLKGITFQFDPNIKSYTGRTAKLNLRYRGAMEQVLKLLTSLGGIDVTGDKMITYPFAQKPFIMKLEKVSREESKGNDSNNKKGNQTKS